MKLRLLPLLAGAIVAITIPVAAQACPGTNGQKTNQSLTPQQQSQLQQIQRNTLQEVAAILTPEQLSQFQTISSGQSMRSALDSLNLTDEQQNQVEEIMQSSKAQKQQLLNSNS
jgi:Spy/CpxP family protein refolding chaperone